MKGILQDDNYRIPHKDGTGFLTHIDIPEKKRQAVIRGDKEVTQEIAAEYNMDMDSLLMEARKERERLEKENERVTRAGGGNDETDKSEIEELPLTNYILSLSKPEQSELKKALIGVAGITVGSVESIPMFVKRLVETGSLNKKEVQKVIEDKVQEDEERVTKAEGGDIDEQMSMLMGPTHTMPDGTVMPGATHEEGEMMESEMPMESDSEMEDNYLDFIIDEALSEEEEDMLMSKLEQDEELSMLFDKVIEVASEFAGSGPVEGPGTGVSDSIPARLSDGEFVFTAKAVEEIGADNLMAMMKEAEMKADERQGLVFGGMPKSQQEMMEENRGILYGGRPQQMDVSEEIQKKMLDYPIIR